MKIRYDIHIPYTVTINTLTPQSNDLTISAAGTYVGLSFQGKKIIITAASGTVTLSRVLIAGAGNAIEVTGNCAVNLNNCTIGNCQYAIKSTGSGAITINNSILFNTAGFDSAAAITLTKCNADFVPNKGAGAVTNTTPVVGAPLFIDNGADFRLTSKARGYLFDSPCLGAASDGKDLGVYNETRAAGSQTYSEVSVDGAKISDQLQLNRYNAVKTISDKVIYTFKTRKRQYEVSFENALDPGLLASFCDMVDKCQANNQVSIALDNVAFSSYLITFAETIDLTRSIIADPFETGFEGKFPHPFAFTVREV